nr:T9SS type A sorting domain-containing protein [uncultured Flavobacterium sp.]
MELKTLLLKNFKPLIMAGVSLCGLQAVAQTNITVEANANWVGGMLCYENTPEQPYMWYNDWGLADVKTEKNTTNNTLTLYPNYNTYDATNAYWSNGAMGNKILEGITMVIDDALATQQFTFTANFTSFTLAQGYTATMFIKTFDANWGALNETTIPVTGTGIKSIPYNAAQYTGGAHVQYGFTVKGLNANPINITEYGNIVVTAGEPQAPQGTEVSIDNTSTLIAYANWFNPADNSYAGGTEWGIPEVKTVLNSDGSIDLHPNFNAYGDGSDAYWANGAVGAKIFEGNTYIDDSSLLNQIVTFNGRCESNTLATGYVARAFIKVLDANYGLVRYINAELASGQDFSLTVSPSDYTNGAHFQYGYSVTGLNANPNQEAALGFAKVTNGTAGVKTITKSTLTAYPNPVNSILNLASEKSIDTIVVYNILGQAVMNAKPATTNPFINVSALNTGVYIINATSAGKTATVRFVKQ